MYLIKGTEPVITYIGDNLEIVNDYNFATCFKTKTQAKNVLKELSPEKINYYNYKVIRSIIFTPNKKDSECYNI